MMSCRNLTVQSSQVKVEIKKIAEHGTCLTMLLAVKWTGQITLASMLHSLFLDKNIFEKAEICEV